MEVKFEFKVFEYEGVISCPAIQEDFIGKLLASL